MKRVHTVLIALALFALPALGAAQSPEHVSSLGDRQSVNVTVYNGGTALVHDRRRISLKAGLNRLAWRDVSAEMDESSVLLKPLGSIDDLSVLEQNFDFDLLDPSALLNRYVGKIVTVVHPPEFAGQKETRERARLLSTNGGIVLQYADRIETQLRGYIVYPSAPANFRDRPTLVLDLDSAMSGPQTLDLSYLTNGMSWRADYVGAMSADETHMSLRGLVTLSNTSGESYENARLQLVAGNVNVAQPQVQGMLKTIARVTSRSYGEMQQENYFEYHLYTLQRPTSILNNQTKQVTMLAAQDIPIRKTLELRGSQEYYESAQPDLGDRLPVGVYVSFDNKGEGLGVPLPAGIVRLYKNDSHGLSQFIGSDNIDHTPKNETVRLYLGNSFDVTARKRQTNYVVLADCTSESSYEIVLSNAKSVPQNVLVVEGIPGDWRIVQENVQHTKSSAATANWLVPVPADGRATLTYTARVKWC
jgi:hypothetical protein